MNAFCCPDATALDTLQCAQTNASQVSNLKCVHARLTVHISDCSCFPLFLIQFHDEIKIACRIFTSAVLAKVIIAVAKEFIGDDPVAGDAFVDSARENIHFDELPCCNAFDTSRLN